MKKIIFLVLFFISAGNCFAQQVTFQKTYGGTGDDRGFSVQPTTDGGYIITGTTNNFGAGDFDVYLIKINVNGDSLWTKAFGGMGIDGGWSVQQTMDGGFIIAGSTLSFGAGNFDIYLIKTDSIGNILWTKTFGGANDDESYAIQQTVDGGYIISGNTDSFGAGDYDAYLIKTDANGDSLWTKTYGGTFNDLGYSVQQTSDGGYIITGYTINFGAGNADIYLIKTDVIGNSIWKKTFGGTNDDEGYSVKQTMDGGYIITGKTTSFGAGNSDASLIKTDTNGNVIWTRTFGGTNYDFGLSVQQTIDGGYIIGGRTSSFGAGNTDVYLIKTDSIGDSLWTRTFGGTGIDQESSVQQTTDGGFIIAGYTSNFGTGNYDVYLIKTDSLGNSGCNEGGTATIITTPATQVTSPATIVTSPPTIVTTPAAIVGSGGIVTTLCTTTNLTPNPSPLERGVAIAPNPTTNNFTITFPNTIYKGVIEIYNVMGVPINIGISENITNVSQKEIHLKNIEAGIYFVKIKDGEKEYCKKLVIE